MTRTRKWLVGIAVFLLLLFVAVSLFDWNFARSYIARKVTDSTGRTFAINGDLDMRLSLRPRIIVNDVVMGNAAWSKDPVMAQIKRADFRIDLLQLLRGRLAFPEISLSELHLVLEVNQDGTPNWIFDQKAKQGEFPIIKSLMIDRGTVTYRDPTIKTDLALEINTVAASNGDPDARLELTGKGQFKGMETLFQAHGGALLALRSADQPYPIKATATLGTTKASIDGALIDPLRLNGQEVNFRLEGSDLALIYTIVGVPMPPTPAYKLAGFLSHSGDIWAFTRLKGTVGKSDLNGDFSVDSGKIPQLITADLVSHNLDLKDLGGIIGANHSDQPSGKVLPTEAFNLEKLRAANADVRFKGAKIITENMPVKNMEAHLIINGGQLKLAPLNFGVAGGNLITEITMDGSKSHMVTHADITAKGLNLDQLFPASKMDKVNTGAMGGRAQLDGSGDSIAKILGTANGEAALIMDGGTVSKLLLRLASLDIANSIFALLGGDKQIPIHCMVANFKAVEGDFKVQALLLDTPKANITGEGNVNFADESLHLKLAAKSKIFSLASLRGPIIISGSFNKPVARPDVSKVAVRGSLAVGLGVMTGGIGALIPLLEFGKDKVSNCAALMSQAKSDAGIKQGDIAPR